MTTTATRPPRTPIGRRISIIALDGAGQPAGARIAVHIDAQPAGLLDLGSGSKRPISVVLGESTAVIRLIAKFLTEEQYLELPPGEDHAEFRFKGIIRFATGRKPLATCPDGTSGSPCVRCHDPSTGKTWEMCC